MEPMLLSEKSPVPSEFLLWPDPVEGPFEVRVLMQVLQGRNECVGIDIKPAPGIAARPLLSSELRRLQLREMIDTERRRYLLNLGDIHGDRVEVADQLVKVGKLAQDDMTRFVTGIKDLYSGELRAGAGAEIRGRASRRGGRPKVYDDAHYREVAAVYTAACRAGDPAPTKAVSKAFTVGKSTAAKWVSTCRERGYLPPTSKGQISFEPESDRGQRGR